MLHNLFRVFGDWCDKGSVSVSIDRWIKCPAEQLII
jgi:hypothetical protein